MQPEGTTAGFRNEPNRQPLPAPRTQLRRRLESARRKTDKLGCFRRSGPAVLRRLVTRLIGVGREIPVAGCLHVYLRDNNAVSED